MKKTFYLFSLLLAFVVNALTLVSCGEEEWSDDDLANYAKVVYDNRDGNFDLLYNGCEYSISKDGTGSVWNIDEKRTSVVLPSEIKYKGKSYPIIKIIDFSNCKYLTQIIIPEGYLEIGGSCFAGCHKLRQISIPESVNSIGDDAFYGCSALETVKIPSKLLEINDCMFEGCSSLNSINLPTTLKSIGDRAFKDCSKLSSIKIPDDVASIGYWAFYGCSQLTSVTLPSRLEHIESGLFYDCTNLQIIHIPRNVTYLQQDPFQNCTNVKEIYSHIVSPEKCTVVNTPFKDYYNSTTLYIPHGSLNKYKQNSNWKRFNNIVEINYND